MPILRFVFALGSYHQGGEVRHMILALDVGNSIITMGGIEGERLRFQTQLSTQLDKTAAEYAVLIKSILEIYGVEPGELEGGIISSVVPPLVNKLRETFLLLTGKRPLVVGPGVKTGLNIAVGDPAELGADLVVAAVAARAKYPCPLVILDLGTATTFTVLGRRGEVLGVIICPGVRLSFDALTSRTAQLPRISYDTPRSVIGTNSVDSMQSGLIYGSAAMIDGLVDRIEAELGLQTPVVATGSLAASIVPHCRREITLDDGLLLDGLRIIYEKNQRKPRKSAES